jgi:hypothetical protein
MNAQQLQFRRQLDALPSWKNRSEKIETRLGETNTALGQRQEKLLGLRSDFDALTLAFWHQFKQNLAPHQEDPGKVFGLLKFIPGLVLIFIFVWAGANWSLLVPLGAAGLGGLCIFVVIAERKANKHKVEKLLSSEQAPFWLTGGSIALSNLYSAHGSQVVVERQDQFRFCPTSGRAFFDRRLHPPTHLGRQSSVCTDRAGIKRQDGSWYSPLPANE